MSCCSGLSTLNITGFLEIRLMGVEVWHDANKATHSPASKIEVDASLLFMA